MEEMSVEQMTMRANQVTDEVLSDTHTHNPLLRCRFHSDQVWFSNQYQMSKLWKLETEAVVSVKNILSTQMVYFY